MDGRAQLPKIVILISGSGSNMLSIVESVKTQQIDAEIAAVISNKADAKGIEKAQQQNIATEIVEHTKFSSQSDFEQALSQHIDEYEPDLIVLAGFMRILSADFVNRYLGKLLNIHPSLLPKYPGLHTHKRALEAGDKEHGATVHFVIPDLDAGPNIVQAVVKVQEDDNEASLQKRVLEQEHIIYPIVINWYVCGRIQFKDNQALFDNKQLPDTGLKLEN